MVGSQRLTCWPTATSLHLEQSQQTPALSTSEPMVASCPVPHSGQQTATSPPQPDDLQVQVQAQVPALQGGGPLLGPLQHSAPSSKPPSDPAPSNPHLEVWSVLTRCYGRMCLDAHEWEWRDGNWLPYYRYQPVCTITELWTEHIEGLGGHLSTRELAEQWGAKWQ